MAVDLSMKRDSNNNAAHCTLTSNLTSNNAAVDLSLRSSAADEDTASCTISTISRVPSATCSENTLQIVERLMEARGQRLKRNF